MRPLALALISTGVLSGCAGTRAALTTLPVAEVFESVAFEGVWAGEIDGVLGSLQVQPLGEPRYYGRYHSEDGAVELVLELVRSLSEEGKPTNLCVFTWQDGQGGRGHGWLLVNREDTALTGEQGLGDHHTGAGVWTFIRVE